VDECEPHYHDSEAKAGVFVMVKTSHKFIDADSGEELPMCGAGLGWDSGDKGVYKAITGAMKYMLMKNFLVTDEQDPEAGDQADTREPADGVKTGAAKHTRTKPYEEETGSGDKKAAADLLELKAFLTEHKIPDGFLLSLLAEKKLIDGHTKNVAQLKPGVLIRCLGPKTKANLLSAWKTYQEDEASGGATAAAPPESAKGSRIVTSEGDQTRREEVVRPPIDKDVDPTDMLAQDGFENWREVKIHWGDQKGTALRDLNAKSLKWWITDWHPKMWRGKWNGKDLLLDAALVLASRELWEKMQ
jgi:hypothetical protein